MVEKDRPWPNLSNKSLRDLEPGDQRPLPRSKRPGQHRRADPRAEIDQRHDVMKVMAVIVLVRSCDQQMFASDSRRAREPFGMQPALARSVRRRPLDDRLDRRQVAFPIGDDERVAPDAALGRNEEAKGRKPILLDDMIKRHRRRMDGMIEIVGAFRVGRIDAERMQLRLVLRGRDHLALRQRGRQTPFIGDSRKVRLFVEDDANAFAGHRQRIAQPAAEIAQWRAKGVAPRRMQRSIDADQLFVFDSVARHAAPLGVQHVRVCSTGEG